MSENTKNNKGVFHNYWIKIKYLMLLLIIFTAPTTKFLCNTMKDHKI